MTTIDLVTLKSIRRMLRASIRHTEIARRFDLAVGTISRIASVRRLRRLKLHLLTAVELPEDDQPPEYLAANLRRCPGCGGMVYQWPCLACRIRAAQEAGLALADGDETADCKVATIVRAVTSGREGEGARGRLSQVPHPSSSPPLPLTLSPPRLQRSHAHAHA